MTDHAPIRPAADASADEDETYHLLVDRHLEERLVSLCRSGDGRGTAESSEICPACRNDLGSLGLAVSGFRCPHGR